MGSSQSPCQPRGARSRADHAGALRSPAPGLAPPLSMFPSQAARRKPGSRDRFPVLCIRGRHASLLPLQPTSRTRRCAHAQGESQGACAGPRGPAHAQAGREGGSAARRGGRTAATWRPPGVQGCLRPCCSCCSAGRPPAGGATCACSRTTTGGSCWKESG